METADIIGIIVFFGVIILAVVVIALLVSINQINEYEKGVVFTLGKYSGMKEPGWRIAIIGFQKLIKIDLRTIAEDVPEQHAITKDNVSLGINAVIYYKVSDASNSIIKVRNYSHAVSQLAQTTMRNAVGEVTLDELLASRDQVSSSIQRTIDKATEPWGIKVENVELKDIKLPENMERVIAKVAEAERERRAIVTKSLGEVEASHKLAEASRVLSEQPGSMHLRTLSTLKDLSSDKSNTVVFAIPVEILRAFDSKATLDTSKIEDIVAKYLNSKK